MSDQEPSRTAWRQAVQEIMYRTPIPVSIHFTHEVELHGVDNDDDTVTEMREDSIQLSATVLLMLTDYYDREIEAKMRNSDRIDIEMPFGCKRVLEILVNWIIYAKEPSDFVEYQEAAEFARYYRISLPPYPDQDIIEAKLDDMDLPPSVNSDNDEQDMVFPKYIEWEGRVFRKKYQTDNRCYYRCRTENCPGSLSMKDENEVQVIHEHMPNCEQIVVKKEEVCETWQNVDTSLRQVVREHQPMCPFDILSEYMNEYTTEAKVLLQAPLSVVLACISQLRGATKDPLSHGLTECVGIDSKSIIYQQIIPEPWVIYSYSGVDSLLRDVKWLLIDGTFHCCPKPFAQLVTLLARHDDTGVFFPVCHVLMPNRLAKSYRFMYDILDQCIKLPQLESITVDFERALIQETASWVSRNEKKVEIFGCKFHFSKALTKHFRKKSRKRLNEDEKALLHAFLTFPFLEKHDVIAIMDALRTCIHNHAEFLDYFNRVWMQEMMFDIWNASGKREEGLFTRFTNNGIESLHATLKRFLRQHPRTDRLLRWLQNYAEEKIRDIDVALSHSEIDANIGLIRRRALFHWLELLCDYETKPEFCSLHFSFTCPECNTFNDLTGRRRHHTQCANEQCKYSSSFLAPEYVLEQAEQTLKASLDAFIEQNTLGNTSEVLRLLHYWFSTRTNDASPDPEIYYNERMISYIAYLQRTYGAQQQTVVAVVGASSGFQRRRRPNRVARLLPMTTSSESQANS